MEAMRTDVMIKIKRNKNICCTARTNLLLQQKHVYLFEFLSNNIDIGTTHYTDMETYSGHILGSKMFKRGKSSWTKDYLGAYSAYLDYSFKGRF